MDAKTCLEIFRRFEANDPHPRTELLYDSDFELLVAVMLSAQATDVSVNKVTRKLFPVAATPERLLGLGRDGLESFIKSINYYRTKAKHLLQATQILVDRYHSRVPKDRVALESLPGVGRKTANVLLNTLFDIPAIAVDTHIFRVANRTGLARGKTPLVVEKKLEVEIPSQYLSRAHHWLVLHGRYVCLARKPLCPQCCIADLCEYPNKTLRMND